MISISWSGKARSSSRSGRAPPRRRRRPRRWRRTRSAGARRSRAPPRSRRRSRLDVVADELLALWRERLHSIATRLTLSGSISMLRSSAGAEWVSAPTEMKSTPVAATSRDVLEGDPARGLELGARPPSCAPPRPRSRSSPGPCCRAAAGRRRRPSPSPTSSSVPALDLDRQVRAAPRGRAERASPHPARERGVVVLDQDRVVEAHPVVDAAARRHRRLLERAQPRGRLAGVEDRGARALDGLRRSARSGSRRPRGGRAG